MSHKLKLSFIVFCGLLISCQEPVLDQSEYVQQVFSSSIDEIEVEVDYMEGFEPEIGSQSRILWNFFESNVQAILGADKTFIVPKSLNQMQSIPAERKNYSIEDLLVLSGVHRDIDSLAQNKASLYIMYVDGFLIDDKNKIRKTVLGASLTGTSIIAIFKPAINSGGFLFERVKEFTEQSVLIHEVGHALGLVENGLPLTSDHLDDANGAHCSNDECVMYWLNEGVADLLDFVTLNDPEITSIVFGDECLNDAINYRLNL